MKDKRNSSRFMQNRECEYFPCHGTDAEGFNCIFCYCPLYCAVCPGRPEYVEVKGFLLKDCSGCDYPHRAENYKAVLEYLRMMLSGGGQWQGR